MKKSKITSAKIESINSDFTYNWPESSYNIGCKPRGKSPKSKDHFGRAVSEAERTLRNNKKECAERTPANLSLAEQIAIADKNAVTAQFAPKKIKTEEIRFAGWIGSTDIFNETVHYMSNK